MNVAIRQVFSKIYLKCLCHHLCNRGFRQVRGNSFCKNLLPSLTYLFSTMIYLKYYKNSNESRTFVIFGQIGPVFAVLKISNKVSYF